MVERPTSKEFDEFETALIRKDYLSVALFIKRFGANARDPEDVPAFFAAIERKDATAVGMFIDSGVDVNLKDNGRDYLPTAFMLNASTGNIKIAKLLLASGIDIDQQNANFETPLYKAMEFGHLKYFNFLLQQGADLYEPIIFGNTIKGIAQKYVEWGFGPKFRDSIEQWEEEHPVVAFEMEGKEHDNRGEPGMDGAR